MRACDIREPHEHNGVSSTGLCWRSLDGSMSKPRTEAGRELWEHLRAVHEAGYIGGTTWGRIEQGIPAIEAEARSVPQSEPPDLEEVAALASYLIIAFRRWCERKGFEPPDVDEFRGILEEASWHANKEAHE